MDSYMVLNDGTPVIPDKRLRQRLDTIVDCFSHCPDSSIPLATSDRNAMDATYDFFKNPRVYPDAVVASCLDYTRNNLQGCNRVLAIQDSSDLNYSQLDDTFGLGYTDGHDTLGLKLHSCLAVRADDGVVAGLLTQQIWSRPFHRKGRAAKRRLREAEDKESYRWQNHAEVASAALPEDMVVVHVADREGDIYNWFAAERPANTQLLVRVAQASRIVVHGCDGGTRGKLGEVVAAQPVLGKHVITVPRKDGQPAREAKLTIRVAKVQLQPPRNAKRRSQLPEVPVWVVEAVEENPPAGKTAIHWRLVSSEEISTLEEALRALEEYRLRWLIERFHYVLKSGFGVEKLQLSTADRLANAVAVYSQSAVRVMRLTYLARREPDSQASQEFSAAELEVLEAERDYRAKRACGPVRTMVEAVGMVARMGGHLGRKGDGPPGVKVLWRGLKALGISVHAIRLRQYVHEKRSIYP